MSLTADALDQLVGRLHDVLRADQVLTSKADRYNRARTPAPFPVHRWSERVPDVVVLPESTEDVVAVVRLANELGVPIVPRDGGTGLTDGAVPLRHGILVDVKRMNQIHEIDLEHRTCTVGVGINMLSLFGIVLSIGIWCSICNSTAGVYNCTAITKVHFVY